MWRSLAARWRKPRELARATFRGLELEDLELRGTSRAGLPSWTARLDGERVKIYACFSPSQAAFVRALSDRPELRDVLPECLARRGEILICRWLPGEAFDKARAFRRGPELPARVARLQARLHGLGLEGVEASDFRYLDYLRRRFRKYMGALDLDSVYEGLSARAETLGGELRVSHPDVVPQNLLADGETGQLGVIDNELLSLSPYPWIDLWNTHRYFGGDRQGIIAEAYLRAYAEAGGDLSPLVEHREAYWALWGLREIGSRLQNGQLDRAQRMGRRWLEDGGGDHPLVAVARRILGR